VSPAQRTKVREQDEFRSPATAEFERRRVCCELTSVSEVSGQEGEKIDFLLAGFWTRQFFSCSADCKIIKEDERQERARFQDFVFSAVFCFHNDQT